MKIGRIAAFAAAWMGLARWAPARGPESDAMAAERRERFFALTAEQSAQARNLQRDWERIAIRAQADEQLALVDLRELEDGDGEDNAAAADEIIRRLGAAAALRAEAQARFEWSFSRLLTLEQRAKLPDWRRLDDEAKAHAAPPALSVGALAPYDFNPASPLQTPVGMTPEMLAERLRPFGLGGASALPPSAGFTRKEAEADLRKPMQEAEKKIEDAVLELERQRRELEEEIRQMQRQTPAP